MHVIKFITPNKDNQADVARLNSAREASSLGRGEWIVDAVVGALRSNLGQREGIDKAVIQAVFASVNEDVKFVHKAAAPAKAVIAFYEDEENRSVEYVAYLSNLFSSIIQVIPRPDAEPAVLTLNVPLISLIRNYKELVQEIVENAISRHFDGEQLQLGSGFAQLVVARMCQVSGLSEAQAREKPNRVKWPRAMDLHGVELAKSFLGGTAIGELLLTPVAVPISDRLRMEHMVLTAGSGHGKSQCLQHLAVSDIYRDGDPVGMVILDSTGDLCRKISQLACFADNDRLLLVDAADYEHPIGLNLFSLGGVDLRSLPPREREQRLTSTVQLYEYVIGGLFGAELTSKQSTVFRFLIRLMLSIPGATIHTLRDVLNDPMSFAHVMETMPTTARQFFLHEFLDKQFNETRKQILRRLYGVLENSTFERMFSSQENRLDLFDALNRGRVVVVNTSREFLGSACSVFGRYIIAVALKAAFDRSRLAMQARRTSYLYVDEASDYFDENIAQLLEQVRKFKLGVVLAHQDLEQMSDALRASVMSNTAIKLAGGGSAKDARYLAHELHTSPEFIMAQYKDASGTRFASYVRNLTPAAVSWRIPFGTLENLDQMSDAEYAQMLARNRAELCVEIPDEVEDTIRPEVKGKRTYAARKSDPDDSLWDTWEG